MDDTKIVVVEDDADTLEYMEMLLETSGYHPVSWPAATGARDLIRREQPAVAILDLQLEQPDSGFSILEELRDDPATAGIPVIIYSAAHRAFQGKRAVLCSKGCETETTGLSVTEMTADCVITLCGEEIAVGYAT